MTTTSTAMCRFVIPEIIQYRRGEEGRSDGEG